MMMRDAWAFVDDEERVLSYTHKHKWGEGKIRVKVNITRL